MAINNIAGLTKNVSTKSTTVNKPLPKPNAPTKGFFSDITHIFQNKKVEKLAENPLAKPQSPEAPKESSEKPFDPASLMRVQNFLKDTSQSTFDKLVGLLPIPESLAPLVKMFLGKGMNGDVKAVIANDNLELTADVKSPGLGINGTAVLCLPITEKPADATLTALHPMMVDKLSQILNPALSKQEQVQAAILLISTLPSQSVSFNWKDGTVNIVITLPNGATLKLDLSISTSKDSAKTSDILRQFLKTILKENYTGIETLLSQNMIFKWDGSSSQFEIRFPQQLALHIEKISSIDLSNPILDKLVKAIANDTTIILPSTIRGTIDFKNPSVQFDKGTALIIKDSPLPDITLDRISYDPEDKKMFLSLKTSSMLIPDALLRNIDIDLKDKQNEATKKATSEKPNVVQYKFIPIKKNVALVPETKHAPLSKPKISAFETLKKMVAIPETLKPLVGSLLADQTALDINVGIDDNVTVAVNNVNIPGFGLVGKASLSIPTQPTSIADQEPVKLNPKLETLIEPLIKRPETLKEFASMSNLIDLALTLPNQNLHMRWEGGIGQAQLTMTLPGGMVLNLDLDVNKIQGKNDPLMAKFLEVLDSPVPQGSSKRHYHPAKLVEVFEKFGGDHPNHAQIREALIANMDDKDALRTELAKIIERDALRTKLAQLLGNEFVGDLEPLLTQSFTFNWSGHTKQFSIKFDKEQKLHIKSLKFKEAVGFGSSVINFFGKILGSLLSNTKISLPKVIRGDVDFETGKINFYKGTSVYVGFKRAGLRMISFKRENFIDIGIACFGGHEFGIDRRTKPVDKTRIAIVDRKAQN
jgi:hypothetical protein